MWYVSPHTITFLSERRYPAACGGVLHFKIALKTEFCGDDIVFFQPDCVPRPVSLETDGNDDNFFECLRKSDGIIADLFYKDTGSAEQRIADADFLLL
jgi:hypothetical protein